MGPLPNHASPPLLYFHMPLPKIVLLLYSNFCVDTYFPDKSHLFWTVTVYLHALIQLYYYITSSCGSVSIGILLHLVVSSGFSCTCHSPAKSSVSEPFFVFADILAIRVVFTQTSHWFFQCPYLRPIRM